MGSWDELGRAVAVSLSALFEMKISAAFEMDRKVQGVTIGFQ
jgi:hypothetical protein